MSLCSLQLDFFFQWIRKIKKWIKPLVKKKIIVGVTYLGVSISKWSEVKSLSRVQLFATPWTVAHQAPPSMGFSRQEYWSGLPSPSSGDLPNPGTEPRPPTLQADVLTSEPPGVTYLGVSISKVIVKSGVFTFFGDLNKSGASLVAQCLKKNCACQCRRHGFEPRFQKIPHTVEQLSPCPTTIEPVP